MVLLIIEILWTLVWLALYPEWYSMTIFFLDFKLTLTLTIQEIIHKNAFFVLKWRVIFEDFGVRMMPRRPAGYDYDSIFFCFQIDADLVLPSMRSAVEQQLNLIAGGKADYQAVLSHGTDIFHRKFKYFVESINGMDELFEVSFSPLAASGKPLSR